MNSHISLEDIEDTPEFLEYTEQLSHNKNITWEFIKKHLDKSWNWVQLSLNSNITWDTIKNNKTCPWSPVGVSSNPNITWDIITNNPEFPWKLDRLPHNTNITWKIVRDNKLPLSDSQVADEEDDWDYWDYRIVSLLTEDLTWKDVIENPDFPWSFFALSGNKFGKK
jgi:hypothetical protein